MDWQPHRTSHFSHSLRRGIPTPQSQHRCLAGDGKSGFLIRREKQLKSVDKELSRGNHKAALKIVKRMQGRPGGLRGFGAAKQVPNANSGLDQLEFGGIDMSYIQPKVDVMLELVISSIQSGLEEEPASRSVENALSWEHLHRRSKLHEAGHFIVAYLLGVLPKSYEVPTIEAAQGELARGHVKMVDFTSPLENLNKFSCIALGGLAAAYLEYGYTGGFVSDIDKLYIALCWLEFTESEAKSYIRWAILNTSQMLLHHRMATLKLADAMALGRSIGYCIATIEDSFI